MKINFLVKTLVEFFLVFVVFTISCKRSDISGTPNPVGPVDDITQVNAGISGIVLDENNSPVTGAIVTSGTATTTTNSNGMFIFNNISVSKNNGSVAVKKAGYFKGVRNFKTTAGKNHSVRIQLMAKVLSGTFHNSNGGTINSNGGATINFPSNAIVTSNGAAYNGSVNVFSRWIDPTVANLPFIIPGDLRGVDKSGNENILETYGMVGAELEDASGNSLKIATDKKATINFPIPATFVSSTPPSIALWHFDDATARWKEEGTAAKSGSIYTVQVDKFSFWNVDNPKPFVQLDYTLINAATNSPLVFANTRIRNVSNGTYGYGLTNNTGFVSGAVPKNEALLLEVVSGCGTVIYSQNIGPFSANASLGNISVALPASQYLTFTGTLLNCSSAVVLNGYLSLYAVGGYGAYANTNTNGTFSFSLLNCTGANLTYGYFGVDNSTGQKSNIGTGSGSSGTVNLGNVIACGAVTSTVYVAGWETNAAGIEVAKIWKNGVATNLTDGTKQAEAHSVFVSGSDVYAAGGEKNAAGLWVAKLWKNGIPTDITSNGTSGFAYSVYVSGNDVYVAGVQSSYPYVWKNGVGTNLTVSPNYAGTGAYASSVFVSGNNVYVAGTQYASAYIWTNAVPQYLASNGDASSVFVSGNDVYVAGYDYPRVTFWKSSGATYNYTYLTSNGGAARSIFVTGSDIYVAGSVLNSAVVWKNGATTPTYYNNGVNQSWGYSVFVFGSDIYVAGQEIISPVSSIAKVWQNGFPINLTDGTTGAIAKSVFVK